ncbi:glycosyltransferase family 2 protein [bacterium]|nr:glycosyltransferase family 2 protein [bacterium]
MNTIEHGLSVIIPCHNERDAIVRVLDQIEGALNTATIPHEIIVVDDGSTDGSADLIDARRFKLVRHQTRMGYGAAIKSGVRDAQYDSILITDADGTYPNERIPDFVKALEGKDMVVGARPYVAIQPIRRPAKWVLRTLAQYLCRRPIPDLNSGFRIFTRELFEKFEHLYPEGFSLTTTITLATLTSGRRVEYVPIEYHPRVGTSKIRPIQDTLGFLSLILRIVLYFDPLRIFLPLSLILIIASVIDGILSKLVFHQVADVSTVLLFVTGVQVMAIGALADLITRRMK